MLQDNAELSALIGSRICHDLISPIGAIGNGLELLQMGLPPSPELSLIAESVENANARVRFFRVAFGRAGAGQPMSLREIDAILRDISRGGRIQMHLVADTSPERTSLRAAFLALMCAETALPLGGDITLTYQSDKWEVLATGRRIQADAPWQFLTESSGDLSQVSAGQVQFALLPGQLQALGRQADLSVTDTHLSLRF